MERQCTRCRRPFAAADLCRSESKGMEAERKAAGLTGVRFLYYHCPECSTDDIFVDLLPLEGESDVAFRQRRDEMETAVRQLHSESTDAVVTSRKP